MRRQAIRSVLVTTMVLLAGGVPPGLRYLAVCLALGAVLEAEDNEAVPIDLPAGVIGVVVVDDAGLDDQLIALAHGTGDCFAEPAKGGEVNRYNALLAMLPRPSSTLVRSGSRRHHQESEPAG